MRASSIVLTVLLSTLLLACSDEKNVPAKTDNGPAANIPAGSDRAGMPAVALKNSCDACHMINAKKVGPAWMEVSRKYKGDPGAEERLIAKVRKGGYGVWGTMPMPPNLAPSDVEIKELVEFILKLSN